MKLLTTPQKEALEYYCQMGMPNLQGCTDYEMNSAGELVTYVDETDYTKKEFEKLEKGCAVYEQISDLLSDLEEGAAENLLEKLNSQTVGI